MITVGYWQVSIAGDGPGEHEASVERRGGGLRIRAGDFEATMNATDLRILFDTLADIIDGVI